MSDAHIWSAATRRHVVMHIDTACFTCATLAWVSVCERCGLVHAWAERGDGLSVRTAAVGVDEESLAIARGRIPPCNGVLLSADAEVSHA